MTNSNMVYGSHTLGYNCHPVVSMDTRQSMHEATPQLYLGKVQAMPREGTSCACREGTSHLDYGPILVYLIVHCMRPA
jgi:hypothetical protein